MEDMASSSVRSSSSIGVEGGRMAWGAAEVDADVEADADEPGGW